MKRLALLCLLAPSIAGAAGLQRPNVVGARAIGLGGAFTAVANDPTAVWHNPAGTAFFGENQAYLGGELILTRREYTPSATSPIGMLDPSKVGRPIAEDGGNTFIPVIGVSTRFGFGKTKPTRFALSLLVYDTYGGSIAYRPDDVGNRGLLRSQILSFELAPALAYQVTDVLSIGAALRIGINQFAVHNVEPAFRAELSAMGVGIGGTLGVMVKPHKMVDIGAVYRTPLSATMTGGGPVTITGQPEEHREMNIAITWPQSAALALTVKPHWRVLTTIQGDWIGWSSVQNLTVNVTGLTSQMRPTRYRDVFQFHVGLQTIITRFMLARIGYAFDTAAIPAEGDCCIRREQIDAFKQTLAAGLGFHVWRLFLDTAFEVLVPTNTTGLVIANQGPGNEAGVYQSALYNLQLSAMMRF